MEKGTTIKAVNNNILKLLTDAGPDGLHEDDLLSLLGIPNKKHLEMRLRDLQGRSQIIKAKGGHWKMLETAATNVTLTEHTAETFITPSLTEELPTVNLPGGYKFTSYRNTLQEYCQKKHMPVPKYTCSKEQHGLIGMVTFALNHVRCEVVSATSKEAEARAAYEALQKLGYLKDHKFDISATQTELKRKEVSGYDYTEAARKRAKKERVDGEGGGKSKLNEHAQRNKYSPPTYVTVATDGGYFSTVTLDGKEYKSIQIGAKRKDAEKYAAQVALNKLNGL